MRTPAARERAKGIALITVLLTLSLVLSLALVMVERTRSETAATWQRGQQNTLYYALLGGEAEAMARLQAYSLARRKLPNERDEGAASNPPSFQFTTSEALVSVSARSAQDRFNLTDLIPPDAGTPVSARVRGVFERYCDLVNMVLSACVSLRDELKQIKQSDLSSESPYQLVYRMGDHLLQDTSLGPQASELLLTHFVSLPPGIAIDASAITSPMLQAMVPTATQSAINRYAESSGGLAWNLQASTSRTPLISSMSQSGLPLTFYSSFYFIQVSASLQDQTRHLLSLVYVDNTSGEAQLIYRTTPEWPAQLAGFHSHSDSSG